MKQNSSSIVGTRGTLWLTDRVAIEAIVSYASSTLSPPAQESTANVLSLGITPIVHARKLGRTAFHVGGGIGFVGRSGDAFYWYSGTTSFLSGIVRAGAAFKVGWGPWQALRVDADYYLYRTRFDLCRRGEPSSAFCYAMNVNPGQYGNTTGPALQRDLVLSLGLAIRVRGQN